MKTIAITTFLSILGLILCMVLGLRWLDERYGPTAVVVAVVAIGLALFMVVIAVILSLFGLVQFRIFTQALGEVAEGQSLNARNVGKLLGTIRQPHGQAAPAEIDAAWWQTDDNGVRGTLPPPKAPFAPLRTAKQLASTWSGQEDEPDHDRLTVA